MKKRGMMMIISAAVVSMCLQTVLQAEALLPAAISPLDWYQEQQQGVESAPDDAGEAPAYVPQAELTLKEERILSPALGGIAVGKTVIPEGWTMEVTDLSISSESITCPNAVGLTVTSPDGKCVMTYLSRRQFKEWEYYYEYHSAFDYYQPEPFYFHSDDDKMDTGEIMHMLDYRDASACCDLMAGLLYGGNPVLEKTWTLSTEDAAALEQAKETYGRNSREAVELVNQNKSIKDEVVWTDLTQAMQTYRDQDKRISMFALTTGTSLHTDLSMNNATAYYNATYWDMVAVYGIWTDADVHDSYTDVFNAFMNFTTVSKEFEEYRSRNALELQLILAEKKSGIYTKTEEEHQQSLDEIEASTVRDGDTYSAYEAWDDYILDQTDYMDSSGTHYKVPDEYEHVFEGDDGTIYVGNSPDGPYGSVELLPTEVGQ